jgi:hypothetical protein
VGRHSGVVDVLDNDHRIGAVQITKLVNVLDQVVGYPAHRLAVRDPQDDGAGVVTILEVVDEHQLVSGCEATNRLGCTLNVANATSEEQDATLPIARALRRKEDFDPVGSAPSAGACQDLEWVSGSGKIHPPRKQVELRPAPWHDTVSENRKEMFALIRDVKVRQARERIEAVEALGELQVGE